MSDNLREAALEYHRAPTRGKISVTPTKPLSNQRDLSLAYSPGVAYACLAIEQDPTLIAPEVKYLVEFIRSAQRGVIIRRPTRRTEEFVADE